MRAKKTSTWITLIALGSLAAVAATSAAAHAGRGRHASLRHLEHRIERLDVEAELRTRAYAILDEARGGERALREQIREAHGQLRSLLEAQRPDTAAIDAQVEGLGALRTQKQKQFLHVLLQIGALLPEDQRAQWFEPPRRGGPRGHAKR